MRPGPGRRLRGAPAGIAAALCALGICSAAQWVVDDDGPADFSSIQAAIEAFYVHTGDTILVKPGLHLGNVVLTSKDLVIRSEAGPFLTILDARGSGSVVSLMDRSSATRIEGFTITGGSDQTGGGVWIYGGGPVVTRNVIVGNSAVGGYLGYGYGGGIEIYGSAAVITRNVVRGNTALDGGGGIDVYYAGPSTPGTCCPLIANNTIVDNSVTSPVGVGGGVLSFASEPHVTSCIIAGNQAAAGGGIWVEKMQGNNDAPSAPNDIFFDNTPNDADSNGNWRPPSSSIHADPLLGEGEGIDLWPRSNSPALDAAEPGLPPGPDLSGLPAAVDSDLDGSGADGDAGALENRSEVTGLTALPEPGSPGAARLVWDDSVNPSVVFNVYASDADPFKTDGGDCLGSPLTAATFTDYASLPIGQVRFYLVTGRDALEGSRGYRSDGSPRPALPACAGG